MRLRSQETATAVFEKVEAVAKKYPQETGKHKEYKDAYAGAAHNLPVLIRQARLCQALAFQVTRSNQGATDLLEHLAGVMGYANANELAREARTASLIDYIRLQTRALETLLWFKRYAVSVLIREASDGKDT